MSKALVVAVAGTVGTDAATGADAVRTAVAPEKRTVAPAEFVYSTVIVPVPEAPELRIRKKALPAELVVAVAA